MMTIAQFCDKHNACFAGREWALRECKTMADVWRKAKPDWLLWVATRQGVLDDTTLRMFAVECARSVQHLMTDQLSINTINVAECYALGKATGEELDAAARAAAWDAAGAAADAAAWAAARDAAWYAAWDAARAAAWAAARAAARDAQADWLRASAEPNFEEVQA